MKVPGRDQLQNTNFGRSLEPKLFQHMMELYRVLELPVLPELQMNSRSDNLLVCCKNADAYETSLGRLVSVFPFDLSRPPVQ
jgi:hypothetical protein